MVEQQDLLSHKAGMFTKHRSRKGSAAWGLKVGSVRSAAAAAASSSSAGRCSSLAYAYSMLLRHPYSPLRHRLVQSPRITEGVNLHTSKHNFTRKV